MTTIHPLSGLGDFLLAVAPADDGGLTSAVAQVMGDGATWPTLGGVATPVERLDLWPGASLFVRGAGEVRTAGQAGAWLLSLDTPHRQEAQAVVQAWLTDRRMDLSGATARFVMVLWDAAQRQVILVTDAFRTYPVVTALRQSGAEPATLFAASDARLLRRAYELPDSQGRQQKLAVDPKAIYHYLNFSFVPNESSIWQGVSKLAPGSILRWPAGFTASHAAAAGEQPLIETWWDARYPEDNPDDEQTMASSLRQQVLASVRRYAQSDAANWGSFLSGGTDSSSISGILAAKRREFQGEQVNSFSIGFAEPGYDELAYAKIASDHFDMIAHQRRVSEADALAVIPQLVDAFDEPFGNASAIPTHYCALMAAEQGMNLLVAGDGGDEIFGGNERYLKDRIFAAYHNAPGAVRGAGGVLASALGSMDSRFPNKIKNFVRRATLPNPDRFYTDDAFASEQFDALLDEQFRAAVGLDDSLDLQRDLYGRADAKAELHRLMYLDLKMTIAANDVVKVTRATRLAGIGVAFPFLDRTLVDFTGGLPENTKLRGVKKRYLFKRAMAGILPQAIVKKKKQGFGLPISVWMRRPGPFRDFVNDTLMSTAARQRGLFQASAIQGLLERHQRGAWDHAAELYILTMLELWQQRNLDGDE